MPSTVAPRTLWSRRTRAPRSAHVNPAVRTAVSGTGKTVVVGAVVAGAATVVVGAVVAGAATTTVVVDGGSVTAAVVEVVETTLGMVVVASDAGESSFTPAVSPSSTDIASDDGTSEPGTFNTTGDPRVTSAPARGNCSTTVPDTPSSPSTASTMAGDPMVLNTPDAN